MHSTLCRSGGMVDTRALRARGDKTPWRFESSLRHKLFLDRTLRGVAQLVERCVWDAEALGSNPSTPTVGGYGSMVEQVLSKHLTGVRFSLPAQVILNMVAVAQLVRASACGAESRAFESPQPPKTIDVYLDIIKIILLQNK